MAPRVSVVCLCLSGAAAAPPGLLSDFRPPASPLLVSSPYLSVWSAADALYECNTTHWSGAASNLAGLVQVDGGAPVVWMGGAEGMGLGHATQVGLPVVHATQTVYTFTLASAVTLTVTFTTPLVVPNASSSSFPFGPSPPPSPDFFSLPATYISWSAASGDGGDHAVRVYFDADATLVTNNSYAYTTPVTWQRVLARNSTSRTDGMRIGAAEQWPLNPVVCGQSVPLTASQTIVWGWLYGLCDGCNSTSAGPTRASRAAFVGGGAGGSLAPDDPSPPKAVGDGFPGLAFAWSAAVTPSTPAAGYVTLFMDEILSHNFSFDGLSPSVIMPPWWRRDVTPLNDTVSVPLSVLLQAHGQHDAAVAACTAFDAAIVSDMLAASTGPSGGGVNASLGGLAMATLASLSYRQVLGHHALAWHPSKAAPWYFLKEIASGGDDSTMDVIYPASPLLLSYSPPLLAALLTPILEASFTLAYRKAWVTHDLGKFPISSRFWDGQEDMPVEETANLLLMVAGIGYRNGSDLSLFQPYYDAPGGFSRWGAFLLASLPFPDRQGTTDDFLGSTANGTNLVIKGCAGLGAWGYIQHVFGNTTGAVNTWTAAGACGAALVEYGWYTPPPSSPPQPGHFAWSYQLANSSSSFFCVYNWLYVRLLRLDNLLPNQSAYLAEQAQFFALDGSGSVGGRYGVPLINGSDGMKLDWNAFLATAEYEASPGPGTPPLPSAFSSSVFVAMAAGANATSLRAPLTDFFSARDASYTGKYRGRPVLGGLWAPVALATLAALPTLPHEAAMAAAFAAGHAEHAHRRGGGGGG